MIHPWDPCLVRLTPGNRSYDGECIQHTFYWDVDGDGTIEGTGSSYIAAFTGPGPHTVCVTMAYEDCEITDCVTFELPECNKGGDRYNSSNESWEEYTSTSIEMFPNPATDHLNITYVDNLWNPTELIRVMDVTGKIVETIQPEVEGSVILDVSNLSRGIYFVQFMNDEGVIATERFIKSQK